MRRTLALWLLLFAAYAATLGLSAFGASDYGGDEPHYLLAAESIVEDGNVDVLDEYADRAYADFYPYALRRSEDFERINTKASLVVDDLGIVDMLIGEGLGRAMAIYQEEISVVA